VYNDPYMVGETKRFDYTFKWYYCDNSVSNKTRSDYYGPYTTEAKAMYFYDEHTVMYALDMASAPEGDLISRLEMGKSYDFVLFLFDKEECVGYFSFDWTASESMNTETFNYDAYWSHKENVITLPRVPIPVETEDGVSSKETDVEENDGIQINIDNKDPEDGDKVLGDQSPEKNKIVLIISIAVIILTIGAGVCLIIRKRSVK